MDLIIDLVVIGTCLYYGCLGLEWLLVRIEHPRRG